MPGTDQASEIERRLEEVGIEAVVEMSNGVVTLSGKVTSPEQRQAASDIVADMVPDLDIDNALEVEGHLPDSAFDLGGEFSARGEESESVAEIEAIGAEIEPDFTDQELLDDPEAAAGPSSSRDDPVAEGNEVYVPPIDPVARQDRSGDLRVLGGFALETDTVPVARSASGGPLGDDAIADAVREALSLDATTTDLEITVYVRNGVVHLRGTVPGIEDAENAEAVASRIEGVVDIDERLRVASG